MSPGFQAETIWRREPGSRLISLDQVGDLVDLAPVRRLPAPPLLAVDRAEIARLVRPFVPDADLVLLQPADIGVAAQEPEQFDQDRAEVQLLGGEQGEALRQVEAHLVAEHRKRAGAGPVLLLDALVEDAPEEVEIGLHRPSYGAFAAADSNPKWRPKWIWFGTGGRLAVARGRMSSPPPAMRPSCSRRSSLDLGGEKLAVLYLDGGRRDDRRRRASRGRARRDRPADAPRSSRRR